ncbi:hypothetical protein TSUD_135150 [Trifolium subterraneum]|uniref:Reverse transcriptase domain-containing protein n=1 Tax=Trifolium subterraneum TaxID=3900 RepID=A0A2Z6NIJ3_TRISU|nr:hypothetical protein TSUD_135150 [Trifolium subterraneum]
MNQSGAVSNQASSKESSTSASVNNDWKNWVVMQGNDQVAADNVRDIRKTIGVEFKGVAADDVRDIGKTIGVEFKGAVENKFSVLSWAGKVCAMKIISWNIRGLGGLEKRKEVRKLVGDQYHILLCLQETKLQTCEDYLCSTLWGNSYHAFSYRPSSGEEFSVANVYAPCDIGAKQEFWDSLSVRIQTLERRRVCVCRDFNAVRNLDERRSPRSGHRPLDHIPFNRFIDDNTLIDLPLSGRKFTWYKGDGLSMNRLDRFLLSEEWCLAWPNCMQVAKMRGLSDHCPLFLLANEEDWGLRPSRMLKCWKDIIDHNLFVKDKWNSLQMDGVTLKGVNPIRQAVVSHFESHFKATIVERPGVDNLSFKRLNQFERSSLTTPFTVAEVKATVWDCDNYKIPGPDGINFGFIKDFWNELQGDVMRFISEFHWNDKLTKSLNSTFIALIPKIDSPQRLNDFRHISLVGCLYKILAKVLANWLCLVIGSVISESQIAFVKDRQILDGILIANEVVDEARKSKKELMMFKVDFEKAYDSVDWGYLDDVMGRMSFPTLWRKLIKECICTATTSVLVNGSSTNEFPLERGLRQGDPLSPFLFLLAAKGLHVLMEAMVERNLFTGYSIGEVDSVPILNLQFADDTFLLGVKTWANVRALRAILVLFEAMSGLKVNFNKSMLFEVNIPDSRLCEAASSLCCRVGKIPFLYLGLPIGGDSRRLGLWKPVLARLKNRLSGYLRKEYGGLRVRQLREFNLALLGKWCWRMLVDREGLWFRALAARYGVERGRVGEGGRRGSSWWREITRIRDTRGGLWGGWFGEHISKKVGDASDTFFWTDPWVAGTRLCERFGRLFDLAEAKSATVAEMFALGRGCWWRGVDVAANVEEVGQRGVEGVSEFTFYHFFAGTFFR